MNYKTIGILFLIVGVILLITGIYGLVATQFKHSITIIGGSIICNVVGVNLLMITPKPKNKKK